MKLPLTNVLTNVLPCLHSHDAVGFSSHSPGPSTYRSNMSEAMDQYGMERASPKARVGEDLDPRARLMMVLQNQQAHAQITEAALHASELDRIRRETDPDGHEEGEEEEEEGEAVEGDGGDDDEDRARAQGWVPEPGATAPPLTPRDGEESDTSPPTGADGFAQDWFGSPLPGAAPGDGPKGRSGAAPGRGDDAAAPTAAAADPGVGRGSTANTLPPSSAATSGGDAGERRSGSRRLPQRSFRERPVFIPTARQIDIFLGGHMRGARRRGQGTPSSDGSTRADAHRKAGGDWEGSLDVTKVLAEARQAPLLDGYDLRAELEGLEVQELFGGEGRMTNAMRREMRQLESDLGHHGGEGVGKRGSHVGPSTSGTHAGGGLHWKGKYAAGSGAAPQRGSPRLSAHASSVYSPRGSEGGRDGAALSSRSPRVSSSSHLSGAESRSLAGSQLSGRADPEASDGFSAPETGVMGGSQSPDVAAAAAAASPPMSPALALALAAEQQDWQQQNLATAAAGGGRERGSSISPASSLMPRSQDTTGGSSLSPWEGVSGPLHTPAYRSPSPAATPFPPSMDDGGERPGTRQSQSRGSLGSSPQPHFPAGSSSTAFDAFPLPPPGSASSFDAASSPFPPPFSASSQAASPSPPLPHSAALVSPPAHHALTSELVDPSLIFPDRRPGTVDSLMGAYPDSDVDSSYMAGPNFPAGRMGSPGAASGLIGSGGGMFGDGQLVWGQQGALPEVDAEGANRGKEPVINLAVDPFPGIPRGSAATPDMVSASSGMFSGAAASRGGSAGPRLTAAPPPRPRRASNLRTAGQAPLQPLSAATLAAVASASDAALPSPRGGAPAPRPVSAGVASAVGSALEPLPEGVEVDSETRAELEALRAMWSSQLYSGAGGAAAEGGNESGDVVQELISQAEEVGVGA